MNFGALYFGVNLVSLLTRVAANANSVSREARVAFSSVEARIAFSIAARFAAFTFPSSCCVARLSASRTLFLFDLGDNGRSDDSR